jgi:outer membrane protein assembly factor BamA
VRRRLWRPGSLRLGSLRLGSLILCALLPSVASIRSAAGEEPHNAKREFNIVPVAGGDSDVGIGFGEVSDLARLDPKNPPFAWRLESGGFISFKVRDSRIVVPYQDYYLLLSVPNIGGKKRLGLDVRASFTDESTLTYYGIGNASAAPVPGRPLADLEYGRMHPTLSVGARVSLLKKNWFWRFANVYTHNWLSVPPGSVLAEQQTTGTPEVRRILGNFGRHGVDLFEMGLEYDSRDNEIVTTRGMFHSLKGRLSPAVGDWLPYKYAQVDGTARFYVTLIPRWLTVSFRLVGDLLWGTTPFYQLARYEESPGIGGAKAIRGVPANRYYGKVKVFENLQVRSSLFSFQIAKKQFVLGSALFFDAGRTWTEISRAHPELDGRGLGLKYGLGGGLRLQEGETFVIRADIAWSPDATPIGAYFAAGEIF